MAPFAISFLLSPPGPRLRSSGHGGGWAGLGSRTLSAYAGGDLARVCTRIGRAAPHHMSKQSTMRDLPPLFASMPRARVVVENGHSEHI